MELPPGGIVVGVPLHDGHRRWANLAGELPRSAQSYGCIQDADVSGTRTS